MENETEERSKQQDRPSYSRGNDRYSSSFTPSWPPLAPHLLRKFVVQGEPAVCIPMAKKVFFIVFIVFMTLNSKPLPAAKRRKRWKGHNKALTGHASSFNWTFLSRPKEKKYKNGKQIHTLVQARLIYHWEVVMELQE